MPDAGVLLHFWQFIIIISLRTKKTKFSEPGSKCLYTGILFIAIKDLCLGRQWFFLKAGCSGIVFCPVKKPQFMSCNAAIQVAAL